GSICRMESSIIVRVAAGKPHIFSCCGRNEYCFPCPINQHHLDCCNAHCVSDWGHDLPQGCARWKSGLHSRAVIIGKVRDLHFVHTTGREQMQQTTHTCALSPRRQWRVALAARSNQRDLRDVAGGNCEVMTPEGLATTR